MNGLDLLRGVAANALDEVRRYLKPDGYRVALVIAHPTDREMDIVVTDADVSLLLTVLRERGRAAGEPDVPLGPLHRGWRVSLSGLISNVKAELKRGRWKQMYAGSLDELEGHIRQLSDRFYAGDLGVVDEFLQLYGMDDNRPKPPKVVDHG